MEPTRRLSSNSTIMRKTTSSNNLSFNSLSLKKKDSITKVTRKPSNKAFVEAKKVKKKLPENFFEQILDLELKLKRDFNMDTLQSLVDSYSVAIEFYEGIEDRQYKDYQNRLNNLLSNPEILKKMNDFNLRKRNSEPDPNFSDLTKKMMLEQEKKQIIMKVNYSLQINGLTVNEEKVQKIISDAEANEDNKQIVNMALNEELTKQQDLFKSRLEEKRKKQSSSMLRLGDDNKKKRYSMFLNKISGIDLSDLASSIDNASKTKSQIKLEEINEKDEHNKKIKSFRSKVSSRSKSNKSLSSRSSDKTVNSDDSDSEDDSEKSDKSDKTDKKLPIISHLDNSLEKFEQTKIKEFEELFSPIPKIEETPTHTGDLLNSEGKQKENEVTSTMFKINENLNDSKHIGPKHYKTFFEIKETLDNFVNDFNFYFYEHVYQKFVEHVQKLMDEKYQKYIEISKMYHGQIKEMEYLITEDSEDEHKLGIMNVIESLKDERQHELDKIDDNYNKLISEAQNSLKNFGFKNNPGIQLIEEKFKLDMYNLLNMLLQPKNR